MQFISVRDFRTSSAAIWKRLPEEQEMVITNNGRPIALLTPLTDRDLEENLAAIRQAKALQAVRKIQMQSIENGTNKMTLEEINREISEVRKERARRERAKCE